jgi:hypothetical protein
MAADDRQPGPDPRPTPAVPSAIRIWIPPFRGGASRIGVPLVDAYLRQELAGDDGPGAVRRDTRALAAFCRWLAATRPGQELDAALRTVRPEDVLAFALHELRPQRGGWHVQAGSVYRELLAVHRFFEWSVAAGRAAFNPVPAEHPPFRCSCSACAGPGRRQGAATRGRTARGPPPGGAPPSET